MARGTVIRIGRAVLHGANPLGFAQYDEAVVGVIDSTIRVRCARLAQNRLDLVVRAAVAFLITGISVARGG
jgi:hypothetical protein